MPVKRKTYSRRYKKYGRPRKYTKRYRKFRSNHYVTGRPVSSLRAPGVYPKRLRAKFTYSEQVSVTSTLGTLASYIFRGNSPYDPNQSGTGNQPPGFDEMSTYFNNYNAYASKIMLTLNTASTIPINVILVPYYVASGADFTWANVQSFPSAKKKTIGNLYNGGRSYMRHYSTTMKELMLGVATAGTWSAFNTNPANQWYWVIAFEPIDQSTTTNIIMTIKVTYYCMFKDRKIVANS